ncbi:MAG: DASS family sodium-coupled anion symporter, partial [Candidatus Thermoplasmatota archaeon]|nr:DASS family sodium-coupled anion symporter [Candidatus Thermoplasmatota archaeon]
FAKVTLLSVAFGCSIGSLGTLVGGARNPITLAFLAETSNIHISFFDWIFYSMPVVLLSIPVIWFVLIKMFPIEITSLKKAHVLLRKEVTDLGPMKPAEITTISITLLTILGWVFLHYQLGPAVVAILGGLLLFFLGLIEWEDVEKRVPWGIILLYGGAITLGVNLYEAGAADWIALKGLGLTGNNPFLVLIMLVVMTIFLTSFMSNTAAVAMLLPIGLGMAEVSGLPVIVTSMTIALSGGLAFMLVIATPGNAITYSTGYYSTRDLLKSGSTVTILCAIILLVIALTYWKLIGLW